jgi:hypothetical protein
LDTSGRLIKAILFILISILLSILLESSYIAAFM